MPHFGLMDEQALGPVEAPRQRSRLHIRSGRRKLRQGKRSSGIATLYDALEAAMEFYRTHPAHRSMLQVEPGENGRDSRTLYAVLVRSGVLDGAFDFEAFDRLAERALDAELADDDDSGLLTGLERVFTQLGIMPFEESQLPPEDPHAF